MPSNPSATVQIGENVVELQIDVRRPREIIVNCDRADGKEDVKRLVVNKSGRVHLQDK